jgi:hypothetical protein
MQPVVDYDELRRSENERFMHGVGAKSRCRERSGQRL